MPLGHSVAKTGVHRDVAPNEPLCIHITLDLTGITNALMPGALGGGNILGL